MSELESILRLGGKLVVWVEDDEVFAGPPDRGWREKVAVIQAKPIMGIPRLLYGCGLLQDVILNPYPPEKVPGMVLNMIRNRSGTWKQEDADD